MEFEENGFFTNQFFQQFYNAESIEKNYQLDEYTSISECINIIKNGGELDNTVNSVKYILNHIGNLELDDSVEIGPFILSHALDFKNVELSATSIHILAILIRNSDQKEYYEPVEQEFIQKAKEKSEIIFSFCKGPLSPQINDLIFSYINFSNEMLNFSLENQIIQLIVDACSSYLEVENLDQEIFYLKLILSITTSLSNQKKLTLIKYNTISYIYYKVSQIMNLNIPQLHDYLLKIYNAIFKTQPDLKTQKLYNSIFEPLFNNFFLNYANALNNDYSNRSIFLNILLSFSKALFSFDFQKKHPINSFIISYLQLNISDIDDDKMSDMDIIKLSWDIERNLIFQNPDQVKYAIINNISHNALEICEEGTIEMKCYVSKFLSNILYCTYDQQIFEYVEEKNILEILLSLIEILPIDYSEYIIKSISFFITNPKISHQNKKVLTEKAGSLEVYNSLTNFIGLYPDNDVHLEASYILGYFNNEFDENYNSYEEDEAEIM